MSTSHPAYEVTLRPDTGWVSVDFRAIWEYRDLLWLLVWRNFVATYKQTVLGPLWFILQPLLTTLVFTVVFGNMVGISTDGLPPVLFYLCGQLGWNYFAQTLGTNAGTLVTNAPLFSKVYFPRLIVPLSTLITSLLAFVLQALTFAAFFAFFKQGPQEGSFGIDWRITWLPLIILQTAALSFGVSLLLSALTAKYRDLTHVTPLVIQLWMYVTPVIYPLSEFPHRWRWIVVANPMTAIVEAFRLILLGTGTVETSYVLWSVGATAGLLICGLILFARIEKSFVDTV